MKISGARSEALGQAHRPSTAQAGARAGAAAPAPSAGRADRVAFLGIPEGELTPAVLGALRTLAGELDELRGEVTRLKSRLTEVEGLADRDALTPLLNRRAFVRELGRVQTFSRRYGTPASLVYFDLDAFKAINDKFGHAAGDLAIQTVAERLIANRDSDVVGRMGGDEFAVILVQADQATAEAKAATLVEAVEREPVPLGEGSAHIRLSFGVREIPLEVPIETLIAETDRAMFAAKRERREGGQARAG